MSVDYTKIVHPYLGKHVEKCCGMECIRSVKIAVIRAYHVHMMVEISPLSLHKHG